MMSRRRLVVRAAMTAAWLLVCVGCAHPDPAGRSAIWQLRGAIVSFDHGDLRVRHKSGEVVAMAVDGETLVLHDGRPADVSELRSDARVVIDVEPLGGGRQRARRVRVFGGA
jgi:hypothetical protein